MNSRMPATELRLRRSRSITAWVETPSRSAIGFSAMNIVPRLEPTPPGPPPPPSVDPTLCTAGSAITMSASFSCRSRIAWNEISAEALVEPITKPESSIGK